METITVDVEVEGLVKELSGVAAGEKVEAMASGGYNRLRLTLDANSGRIIRARVLPFSKAYNERVEKNGR